MISYSRDQQQEIPSSAVKIIGLGGAGANMLERIALDSIEGAELLALNTDIRTLDASLAKEKLQLGVNLTKGLGTGGDPELGQQAMLEAETKVREAMKGQQIIFLCTGLGGGTGSGAAPILARIAREEGAFVVVFATMPFFFEGRRRREQAETALNQLAVLSNALVTFDNNRMGELVLAKQGIHEAFSAADKMISESIKAVIRLVVRPGLINVGLDDLMSALRTTRSRCLFGSGVADGKDRAAKALKNALNSPLLNQGALLKEAQTVLVHLSGGESLTLFEIELLMQNLQKHVPEKAHVLFGAAIDPAMGDELSITLISALPEDALSGKSDQAAQERIVEPSEEERPQTSPPREPAKPEIKTPDSSPKSVAKLELPDKSKTLESTATTRDDSSAAAKPEPAPAASAPEPPKPPESIKTLPTAVVTMPTNPAPPAESSKSIPEKAPDSAGPFSLAPSEKSATNEAAPSEESENTPVKKEKWSPEAAVAKDDETFAPLDKTKENLPSSTDVAETLQLKLDSKGPSPQSELAFDKSPKGRFEGENPNVFDGEDLDLPPFLRKKHN